MGTWWHIEWLPLDDCISLKVIKSCNMWIMLELWPLKYPCANISPNLFLQQCKQQHLDKLKEVKTPYVLVGASNGGHSMITNLLPQLTKSNILWFLLDFWPLKILEPTWTQLYFSEMQGPVLRYTKLSESTMDTCWRIKQWPLNDCIFFASTHKK